jgi:hypothetical protein
VLTIQQTIILKTPTGWEIKPSARRKTKSMANNEFIFGFWAKNLYSAFFKKSLRFLVLSPFHSTLGEDTTWHFELAQQIRYHEFMKLVDWYHLASPSPDLGDQPAGLQHQVRAMDRQRLAQRIEVVGGEDGEQGVDDFGRQRKEQVPRLDVQPVEALQTALRDLDRKEAAVEVDVQLKPEVGFSKTSEFPMQYLG